jgi:N-acetylmuramoyl-L-alanine amidase
VAQAIHVNDSLAQQLSDPFVVVLDAGHGGHDPGNLGSGLKEKEIALAVTLRVGELLGKHRDVKIIYTRDDDSFVKLRDRARIANDAKADLFVSIHCNSVANPHAHGIETFVLGANGKNTNLQVVKKENSVILLEEDYKETYAGFDPNDPASFAGSLLTVEDYLDDSIQAAVLVQQDLTSQTKFRDRGVKEGNLAVLRLSYMPSILIEIGFLTNQKEAKFLNSKNGKEITSQAIYQALYNYIKNRDVNEAEVVQERPQVDADDVIFKVQISASSRNLPTKPSNFKGLQGVTKENNGVIFRYYAGNTASYQEIKRVQQEAIAAGFEGAFVVAFRNGKKIDLAQVLNDG